MSKEKKNINDDLIQTLSEDLVPVKPLRAHYIRSLLFLLVGYSVIFCGISFFGFRSDIHMIWENYSLLAQLSVLMAAGLLSTFATFKLTLPCEKICKSTWIMIILSIILISSVMVFCAMGGSIEDFTPVYSKEMIIERVQRIGLIAVIPTILMVVMIRRGRPVHSSLIGLTSFMAITALSVTGCRLSCPIDSLYGNLLWHYIPIAIISIIGLVIGRYIYRW